MSGSSEKLGIDRIYDYPNLSGHTITNIEWSPRGRYLSYLLGHSDGAGTEIRAFDTVSGERRLLFDVARIGESAAANARAGQINEDYQPLQSEASGRIQAAQMMRYQWFPQEDRLLVTISGHPPEIVDIEQSRHAPITGKDDPIRNAQLSPDGRFISFVRGWDLAIIDIAAGGREYPITWGSSEALRSATGDSMGDLLIGFAHWWSPDSQAIAYIQTDERAVPVFWYADLTSIAGINRPERFPRPGEPLPAIVLKVARGKQTTLIDTRQWPGYTMARVSWLPDSRHIALQMINREQNELCVVLADSYTGQTRAVLTETDPAWINVVDNWYFFSDSSRFIWSSERDSLRQIYVYDINGQQLAQLTDGSEACVAVRGVDEKRGSVFFQVFPEPFTDARLRRVDFSADAGGYEVTAAETLEAEPGSHFAHLSPDCSHYGDIHSTAVQPPRLDLRTTDGRLAATVEENPTEELDRYGLREFRFQAHRPAQLGIPSDSMPVYSKLLEPASRESGKTYPVIVYIYGGPSPGGFGLARNVLNYWRPAPELWMQMMAQQGFGVFSLDNRGSNAIVRGHDFETPIHRQLGRVELADQLAGVDYLKTLDWVDSDRIGIIGGSFGGFMTYNAMLRSNNAFRAGCVYAGVSDWRNYDAVYTERYMDSPDDNPEGYDETALRRYASQLENPLLLVHGGSDPNVHLQHTFCMVEQLILDEKDYSLLVYPNQVHMSFFGMGQSTTRLWTRITRFFEEALK